MGWGAGRCLGEADLSQQVLVQAVPSQQHLALVLATLQLEVLTLAPQQPRLLLRLALLQLLLLPQQPLGLLPLGRAGVLLELLGERGGQQAVRARLPTTGLHPLCRLPTSFSCSFRSL